MSRAWRQESGIPSSLTFQCAVHSQLSQRSPCPLLTSTIEAGPQEYSWSHSGQGLPLPCPGASEGSKEQVSKGGMLVPMADRFPDVLPASATDPNCRTSPPRPPGSIQWGISSKRNQTNVFQPLHSGD
ncbi:hypothetical protein H8959_019328 [Pygathrix nigripes]